MLASVTMVLTIALVAAIGMSALALPLGAAILLGAVLAPTDPVLASEVQLRHAADRDALRFALSAEGGLNDGTAFPFVMLGLGLLGVHALGQYGWRRLAFDVLWAVAAGLAVGWIAAIERESPGAQEALEHARDIDAPATDPRTAPAQLAHSLLGFNEQLEKMVELGMVLCLGVMLASGSFDWRGVALAAWLLLLARPLAVWITLGRRHGGAQTALIGWFGIRGIGSIYYLPFAINHGVQGALARQLADLVLTVLAVSVLMHGISATPLMQRYEARLAARSRQRT